MPFKSEAQRRYLWANESEIARDWTEPYGSRIQKNNGGIANIKRKGFKGGGADMSTVSAAELGISSDTSKREYTPEEKKEHRETRELNQRIENNRRERERERVKQEILMTPLGRNKPLNKFGLWNANFQRNKNLDLARKRAFQKYKDLEKYVHGDFDMDYDFTVDIYGNKVPKGLEYLVSNKGTPIETQRKNLYDVNPTTKYTLTEMLLGKIRPDTQVTLENTLNKARDYNQLVLDSSNLTNQQIKDTLTDLKNRGKTPDQIDPPRDGEGGQQAYLPLPYQQILPEEETEREQKEFAYRFGDTQNVGADVTRASYIFNQGGRVPAAGGGIMNVVPRQGFFLGKIAKGIGKAVGSVAKAAGKVLKSDFGKAALIGLGGYYLGGGQMFGLRPSAPGFSFSNLGKNLFLKSGKNWGDKGALSLGKILGLSAALPFIPGINDAKQDTLPGSERGGRLLDSQGNEALPADLRAEVREAYESGDADKIAAINDYYNFLPGLNAVRLPDITPYLPYPNYATGGRVAAQEGGLMNLGGMEKDYRNTGGFVDIGAQEKADDVPARLSVNEFVMTADAVRNAGGGDIDKGAEVMENMMKNLENGGRVSEESQGKGNTGAQEMFSVSERIGEVI